MSSGASFPESAAGLGRLENAGILVAYMWVRGHRNQRQDKMYELVFIDHCFGGWIETCEKNNCNATYLRIA